MSQVRLQSQAQLLWVLATRIPEQTAPDQVALELEKILRDQGWVEQFGSQMKATTVRYYTWLKAHHWDPSVVVSLPTLLLSSPARTRARQRLRRWRRILAGNILGMVCVGASVGVVLNQMVPWGWAAISSVLGSLLFGMVISRVIRARIRKAPLEEVPDRATLANLSSDHELLHALRDLENDLEPRTPTEEQIETWFTHPLSATYLCHWISVAPDFTLTRRSLRTLDEAARASQA